MDRLESSVAVGVVSVGVWSLYTNYTGTAPSLADLRNTHPHDTTKRQQLLDCDMLVGATALLGGIAISVLMKNVVPLLLAVLSFTVLSYYHHAALAGPTPTMIDHSVKDAL